jgi:hypothetical protein
MAGVESDLILGDTESRGAAGKRLVHQLRTITRGKAHGKASPSRRHGHASAAHDGVRRARALGGAIAHRAARHRPRGSAISGRVCAGGSGVTLRIRSRDPAVICERPRFLSASRLGRANQGCKTDEREPVRSRMFCGCFHGASSNRLAGQRVPCAIDGFLGDNFRLIDRFGSFSIRWPSLDVLRQWPMDRVPANGVNPQPGRRRWCLSDSKGASSFEKLYSTSRHQAAVPASPALRAAFRMFGHIRQHLRHVLEGVP